MQRLPCTIAPGIEMRRDRPIGLPMDGARLRFVGAGAAENGAGMQASYL